MLTRVQLRSIHQNDLPLHILEQDYVQLLFLKELYSISDRLVFKGGTFIRHAFGLDRYSEDLDFTMNGEKNVEQMFKRSAHELRHHGLHASIERAFTDDLSFKARLRYRGPLFDGSERSVGTIRLEVSMRDDVLLSPEWIRLFSNYSQLRVLNVLGLAGEEVLAEKIRAMSVRNKARDLYDVWFLLHQDMKADVGLFERKMKIIGRPSEVVISSKVSDWDRDLKLILTNPPEYGKVRTDVVIVLSKQGYTFA
jgi:predicted nucleotidyltransferase component of viral defense system